MQLLFKSFNLLFRYKIFFIYVPLYNLYKNIFECREIQKFKTSIKPGDIVIDAGANIGFFTILFAKLVGSAGRVIAFEPDLQNFSLLKSRASNYKNISLINAALSDSAGILDLYLSLDLNVDHRTYDSGENREKISVTSFKLDDYLQDNKIAKVDFIKTDLQGYDPIAIRGMKKTIANTKKLTIHAEFWPWGIIKTGESPTAWLKELSAMGLKTDYSYRGQDNESYYTSILLEKA